MCPSAFLELLSVLLGHKVSGCDETEGNAEKFSGAAEALTHAVQEVSVATRSRHCPAVLPIKTHIFLNESLSLEVRASLGKCVCSYIP